MPPHGHQGAPGPRSRAKLPEQEERTGPAAAWGGHPASFTPRGAGTPLGAWALRGTHEGWGAATGPPGAGAEESQGVQAGRLREGGTRSPGWHHAPQLQSPPSHAQQLALPVLGPEALHPAAQGGRDSARPPTGFAFPARRAPSPWRRPKLRHSVSQPNWDRGLWMRSRVGWPPRAQRPRGSGHLRQGCGVQGTWGRASRDWGWETLGLGDSPESSSISRHPAPAWGRVGGEPEPTVQGVLCWSGVPRRTHQNRPSKGGDSSDDQWQGSVSRSTGRPAWGT